MILSYYVCIQSFSQGIGINSTGAPANPDAGLDVDFNNRGVLIPRVNITNLNQFNPPITSGGNTTSLIVYNTNNTIGEGYYYWDGTRWVKLLIDIDAWLTNGNVGTNPTNNFIGTIDNTSLVFRTNNTEQMRLTNTGRLGIATANPDVSVHINTSDAIRIPTGTTAQQPAAPPQGAMRYNTTIGAVEIWTGTCWMNVNTPPVGATYIQWFNAADPNTIYPCTQWIATDIPNGAFIRARGGEANVAANAALTGVVQPHAIQQHNHTGTVTINNSNTLTTSSDGSHNHTVNAVFHGTYSDSQNDPNIINNCPGGTRLFLGDDYFWPSCANPYTEDKPTSFSGNHTHTIPPHNHTGTITINNNTGANTSPNETRPTNVAVIFWRRIN